MGLDGIKVPDLGDRRRHGVGMYDSARQRVGKEKGISSRQTAAAWVWIEDSCEVNSDSIQERFGGSMVMP